LRTVDRAGGQAAAEVAEPLLLDHRVRAEVLPEGHHRLRQHARRRQGHLLGVLPRRPQLRAHLRRDAQRAVPRQRLAEVPARERTARVQTPGEEGGRVSAEAFEKARAEVGVIDTMIGFPAPREEQAKQYDFIRKQTHDSDSQEWEFPAQYMFKGVPHYEQVDDPVDMLMAKMNQHGIAKAVTGIPVAGTPRSRSSATPTASS